MNRMEQEIKERQWSITELARRMGTSRPFTSDVIHGRREAVSKRTAERFAQILEIDPADVMWPGGREIGK